MEKIVKLILTVVLIVFAQYQVQAQVIRIDSEFEKKLQTRAKERVLQMNDYITNMVDKRETPNNRRNYRKAALNLFISYGKPFKIEGVLRDGVKMETVTVKPDGKKIYNTRLMTSYFDRLINLVESNAFTELSITSVDVCDMKATTLKKINDTLYTATVSFGQWYDAQRGERGGYHDFTEKHVEVYFTPVITPTGKELIPFLGDVKAGEAYRTDGRY